MNAREIVSFLAAARWPRAQIDYAAVIGPNAGRHAADTIVFKGIVSLRFKYIVVLNNKLNTSASTREHASYHYRSGIDETCVKRFVSFFVIYGYCAAVIAPIAVRIFTGYEVKFVISYSYHQIAIRSEKIGINKYARADTAHPDGVTLPDFQNINCRIKSSDAICAKKKYDSGRRYLFAGTVQRWRRIICRQQPPMRFAFGKGDRADCPKSHSSGDKPNNYGCCCCDGTKSPDGHLINGRQAKKSSHTKECA